MESRAWSVATALCVALAWPAAVAAQDERWPLGTMEAAILGCRTGILDSATKDFMARRNLTREQLPADFAEKMNYLMGPMMQTCNCAFPILAKEFTAADQRARYDEFTRRFSEVAGPNGPCKMVAPFGHPFSKPPGK